MNDRIEGIVLSLQDYREADELIRVLTKEYGVLTFLSRSSKKMTAKNRVLPLGRYEFLADYREGKTMLPLHTARILEDFYEDKDIEKLAYLNIFPDLCIKAADLVTPEYYEELLFVLRRGKGEDRYLAGCLFFAFLMREFGITPIVDGCAVCGKKQVVTISNEEGGFLCEEHLKGEEALDIERLRKFRILHKASLEHFEILKDFGFDRRDFTLNADFFFHNSDLRLRSYEFYTKC